MNAIILLRPDTCNLNKLLIVDSSMMHMCKNGDIVYRDGAYHAFYNGCLLNITFGFVFLGLLVGKLLRLFFKKTF